MIAIGELSLRTRDSFRLAPSGHRCSSAMTAPRPSRRVFALADIRERVGRKMPSDSFDDMASRRAAQAIIFALMLSVDKKRFSLS